MEKIRVKKFQYHWIDDVVLTLTAGLFITAFALLASASDWARAVSAFGTALLIMGARAKSAARSCAYATVAWER